MTTIVMLSVYQAVFGWLATTAVFSLLYFGIHGIGIYREHRRQKKAYETFQKSLTEYKSNNGGSRKHRLPRTPS